EVPIYCVKVKVELCNPTGAARLKHFVTSFCDMPIMNVEKIAYGMGKKDFEMANCVTASLGVVQQESSETITELYCNLDDMTAEKISFAMQTLLDAGAMDVYSVSAGMKNCRPGVVLCVMCRMQQKDEMVRLIFKHTSTIGIRENTMRRYTLSRSTEELSTPFGTVRVKKSEGYGVSRCKVEYEDLAAIAKAQGLSIEEVEKRIL
ncbi:MAG: LarC family nickel insertion protein, partial [Spirochaetales bacterium]|nr:LarC family nickel insertion protein [Spirochaetales bacterium]